MTKEVITVERYHFGDYVMEVEERDSKACGRIVDFWLYKESYGIKDYMFGLPFDQRQADEPKAYTKEELINIALSNLDEYIDKYFEQYEEC